MKKVALLLCIIAGAFAFAAQRVVVCEEFTATWCVYCPSAARGLDQLYEEAHDSLVVIAYHSSASDPFYTAEAAARASYYSLSGYPTAWFDGALSVVGGTYPNGTMYGSYRNRFNQRKIIDSPLEIELNCIYDSTTNTGSVTAEISNTSANSISGTLQFVITESHINYFWQCMDRLDFLARDMLPDANGESVNIPAGDTILRTRNFTISGSWNERNCYIVVFVQSASKEIYQGAGISLIAEPHMQYYGMRITETNGNGNGFVEPGESAEIRTSAKNMWHGVYTGGTTVQCSSPYITITGQSPSFNYVTFAQIDTTVIFTINVSPSCPDPYLTEFYLNFGTSIDTMPFMVTSHPGFSDNIESGTNGWTLSGPNNNWHITEHKSHSPTHSWYCGVEGSWQYTNNNNSSLISPYFVVTPDSSLRFWHQYSMEPSYDFGYLEIDNGSGWWKKVSEYNGTVSSWTQVAYSLVNYSGQTIRIRFHFTSDGSEVQEGWYIDDVEMPSLVGINETKDNAKVALFGITPNPFHDQAIIKCESNELSGKPVSINIYDASGRLVKSMSLKSTIIWKGDDSNGKNLPSGIYFAKLEVENTKIIQKFIIVR
ncbi:MAG: Omp28-related outer membrane protein [Candidatus Anstonellales archaeon]